MNCENEKFRGFGFWLELEKLILIFPKFPLMKLEWVVENYDDYYYDYYYDYYDYY